MSPLVGGGVRGPRLLPSGHALSVMHEEERTAITSCMWKRDCPSKAPPTAIRMQERERATGNRAFVSGQGSHRSRMQAPSSLCSSGWTPRKWPRPKRKALRRRYLELRADDIARKFYAPKRDLLAAFSLVAVDGQPSQADVRVRQLRERGEDPLLRRPDRKLRTSSSLEGPLWVALFTSPAASAGPQNGIDLAGRPPRRAREIAIPPRPPAGSVRLSLLLGRRGHAGEGRTSSKATLGALLSVSLRQTDIYAFRGVKRRSFLLLPLAALAEATFRADRPAPATANRLREKGWRGRRPLLGRGEGEKTLNPLILIKQPSLT